MFGGVLLLGQAVVARHRAAAAADLASLAAATAWAHGPEVACGTAARVARAQGAALTECRLRGEVADVTARAPMGPFAPSSTARAGPALPPTAGAGPLVPAAALAGPSPAAAPGTGPPLPALLRPGPPGDRPCGPALPAAARVRALGAHRRPAGADVRAGVSAPVPGVRRPGAAGAEPWGPGAAGVSPAGPVPSAVAGKACGSRFPQLPLGGTPRMRCIARRRA
ncbi:Rv3654c family TadE-like protein, partial [Streptomyces sp. NPDC054838]